MRCPASGHEMKRKNDIWECPYCGVTAPAIPRGKYPAYKPPTGSAAGKIDPIESFKQIPGRVAETMMESLTTKPVEFTILGLGFYLGYEGVDLMSYFGKATLAGLQSINAPGFRTETQVRESMSDMWKVPVYGVGGFMLEQLLFPPEEKVEGEDFLKDLPKGRASADDIPDKYPWAKEWAEMKAKILLGCIGALTAYTVTRPGFISGVMQAGADLAQAISPWP